MHLFGDVLVSSQGRIVNIDVNPAIGKRLEDAAMRGDRIQVLAESCAIGGNVKFTLEFFHNHRPTNGLTFALVPKSPPPRYPQSMSLAHHHFNPRLACRVSGRHLHRPCACAD